MADVLLNSILDCKELCDVIIDDVKSADILLDIGFCYGEFALFLDIPVIGYEPVKKPFEFGKKNTVCYAAITNHYGTVAIQLNEEFPICDKVAQVKKEGRKYIEVPCIPWEYVMKYNYFTVLKVDVEGFEWQYDWTLVPDQVRYIFIEQRYDEEHPYGSMIDLSDKYDLIYKKDMPYKYQDKQGFITSDLIWRRKNEV